MPAPGDRYDGDSSSTEDDESVQAYASFRNGGASSRSQYSHNNLFKLDSLMNPQVPRGSDGHHSSCSSDQGDLANGNLRLNGYANGIEAERPSDVQSEMTMKRKRVQVEADAGCNSARGDDSNSNDEDEEDGNFEISEEYYRTMLSEHLQRYKRARVLQAISSRSSVAAAVKRDNAKHRTMGVDKMVTNGVDSLTKYLDSGAVKQYVRKNRVTTAELARNKGGYTSGVSHPQLGNFVERPSDAGMPTSGNLEIGAADPEFHVPPAYSHLAHIRHLPGYVPLEISEVSCTGNMNSIVPTMVSNRRRELWQLRAGMGDRIERIQAQTEARRMFQEDVQKSFPTPVFDRDSIVVFERGSVPIFSTDLVPSVRAEDSNGPRPEGQDGPLLDCLGEIHHDSLTTMRQISSDGGVLRHFEVKVIERGEGYEIIQRSLQREESIKDADVEAKEDFEKVGRHWSSLVRKDLPKHHKLFMTFHRRQLQDMKRFAEFCQREVRTRNVRSLKVLRAAPMRTRRLARDMVIFWKKMDKEQAELRKKEEKDAADFLKREEELREAKRQQQRLNFLLTQTELYSHFMQNKSARGITASSDPPSAALSTDDAGDEADLKEKAMRVATKAANQQMSRTHDFDNESRKLRLSASVESSDQDGLPADSVGDINLLNPSTMPTTSSVQQPKLFQGILKEYQLKGLQWLVNCYEQGLNGILADEMGLGKTIQAMAFLAHLAEEKKIWGPFLVVAPASVLNNWADEVNRFCPDLKILPYWGGLNERTVLRKNINPKRLYRREAAFHVLITSYQLLVSDEKYFRRVKWQYMILDEAQAIKSANSLRWKTLLSFNCRNRLLLTGTPIQNSMAELWALLHFIMPTLFDSHEQFSEWFSKGIESHAEHGGTLNEHQLTRLHAILKPFMLRRVKKDVITEMTNKKELMVSCHLSKRQQAFYQAIKNKISVADLFDSKGAMNEKKVLNLMNIVIQLRKVCNHPELFERNEGHSFLQFATRTNSLLSATFGEPEDIHYSGSCNPISYKVPKLIYRDGMRCLPTSSSGSCQGFSEQLLQNRFCVFSSDHVHDSVFPRTGIDAETGMSWQGGFGFSRFLDLSPADVEFLAKASSQERWLYSFQASQDSPWTGVVVFQQETTCRESDHCDEELEDPKTRAVKRMFLVPARSSLDVLHKKHFTGLSSCPFQSLIISHTDRFLSNVGLLRTVRSFIPPVQAPQIDIICSDRGFASQRTEEWEDPWISRLLVGFSRTSVQNGPSLPQSPHPLIQEQDAQFRHQEPLLALSFRIFGSAPPVQSFDFAKMLTDSGKLHTLDGLLKRLRAGNHRVLLFAQMTKMLNILEDYMNYRKYKYLRLDGSSTIMDRRDMVKDFQDRGDIFVFLLSTRAGGLGINLTAADTVIFYESDWNPTMDLQAMDRAHRLGQTKEVTVYRMICNGTVEEKIMKRASQKNTVQQLVMTGGQSQGDVFQAEEVVSLLLDDAELEQQLKEQKGSKQVEKTEKRKKAWGVSGGKGVRLDAEGGGVSLDDGILAGVLDGPKTVLEGLIDAVGDKGLAGSSELGAEKSTQGRGRKRNGNEGRASRVTKPPKEVKPPKEPKARRDRSHPRIPRPPRDSRLPRVKSGPKKSSEKISGTGGLVPDETHWSSNAGRTEQKESYERPLNVKASLSVVDLVMNMENSQILSTLGEKAGSDENSTPSSEVNTSIELELSPDIVMGKSEPQRVKGIIKKSAEDAVHVKERSRGPKRIKVHSMELDYASSNHMMKNNASHPPIGTLKLSLRKQPAVEESLSSPPDAL